MHRQREVVGDASETALLKFTELTIGNIVDYRARFKKICELPFNSTNKFQVIISPSLLSTSVCERASLYWYGSSHVPLSSLVVTSCRSMNWRIRWTYATCW